MSFTTIVITLMISLPCFGMEKESLEGQSSPLPTSRKAEFSKDIEKEVKGELPPERKDEKVKPKLGKVPSKKKPAQAMTGSNISAFVTPRNDASPIKQSLPSQGFAQRDDFNNDFRDESPQVTSRKNSEVIVSMPTAEDDEDDFIDSLTRLDENCHVFGRCCCGISSGPVKFINMVTMNAKTFITGIAILGSFDADTRTALGVTAAVLNGVGLASGKVYDYTTSQTIALQKELARLDRKRRENTTLIHKEKEAVHNFRMMQFSLMSQGHHRFNISGDDDVDPDSLISSPTDIQTLEKHKLNIEKYEKKERNLLQKQERLTEFTRAERNYYAWSGCFWRYTIGVYIVLELVSGIAEMVLTPLATIPSWQNGTATGASPASALNTSAIVFTALTTFFTYMKLESQIAAKDRGTKFMESIVAAGKDTDNKDEI